VDSPCGQPPADLKVSTDAGNFTAKSQRGSVHYWMCRMAHRFGVGDHCERERFPTCCSI
jgi:hypothetical protein